MAFELTTKNRNANTAQKFMLKISLAKIYMKRQKK